MKLKTSLVCLLFLCSILAFAQNEWALGRPEELSCEKYCVLELFPETETASMQKDGSSGASFLFDAGMIFLPVRDVCVPGVFFNIGGVNDDFASSFSFDGIFTRHVKFSSNTEIISPYYQYLFFGWNNQYFLHTQNKITLALDLKIGWGYESFADQSQAGSVSYYQISDSSSYYTEESYYSSGTIASDNLFVMEPGMNFLYDISRCMSIGAGAHSRIIFGINAESPLGDTGFYSGNIFLRFRIFGGNSY